MQNPVLAEFVEASVDFGGTATVGEGLPERMCVVDLSRMLQIRLGPLPFKTPRTLPLWTGWVALYLRRLSFADEVEQTRNPEYSWTSAFAERRNDWVLVAAAARRRGNAAPISCRIVRY